MRAVSLIVLSLLAACSSTTTRELRPAAEGVPAQTCVHQRTKVLFVFKNDVATCTQTVAGSPPAAP